MVDPSSPPRSSDPGEKAIARARIIASLISLAEVQLQRGYAEFVIVETLDTAITCLRPANHRRGGWRAETFAKLRSMLHAMKLNSIPKILPNIEETVFYFLQAEEDGGEEGADEDGGGDGADEGDPQSKRRRKGR